MEVDQLLCANASWTGLHLRNRMEKVLSQDYREPQFHITLSRAIGRRLRRTYAYVLTIQALAYLARSSFTPRQ